MKFVESYNGDKKEFSIVVQESNAETWRLAMNLLGRGIADNLGFTNDLHKNL